MPAQAVGGSAYSLTVVAVVPPRDGANLMKRRFIYQPITWTKDGGGAGEGGGGGGGGNGFLVFLEVVVVLCLLGGCFYGVKVAKERGVELADVTDKLADLGERLQVTSLLYLVTELSPNLPCSDSTVPSRPPHSTPTSHPISLPNITYPY